MERLSAAAEAELCEQFERLIIKKFEAENDERGLFYFVRFLIKSRVIPRATLKKYVVCAIYPAILEANDRNKAAAIYQISDLTGFSTVYINSILKNSIFPLLNKKK